MVIAIYANLAGYSSSDSYSHFVKALVEQLAIAHPAESFYWIKEEGLSETNTKLANLKTIFIGPPNKLFYQFTLSRKINQHLKKSGAEALLSIDTVIDTGVHQCVLIGKADKKFQKNDFQKIPSIFCLSATVKSELISQCSLDAEKLSPVYGGASLEFYLLSEAERTAIKEKYTQSKEYFLFRGSFHTPNMVQLLKAFSIFKKRQKSDMKIVLLGKPAEDEKEFSTLLNTYKYRDDVVLVTEEEEKTERDLTSAAFAYVQPYRSNSLCFVFDAMQNNIPPLVDASSSLIEISDDAVLYFDTHSAEDIADALMRIYKDERLYADLVAKGKELIRKDYWRETVDAIWNSLPQVKED
jgi:glycosyltransferase involved in cell wall biosynthesis